jgi:ribosome-associated heat shock protein Hsp15
MAERASPASQRLDRWLWCARFARSRGLAAKLCTGGLVSLGDAPVRKAHQPVRIDDRLTLRLGRWERRIEVLALASRRGPASEARTLYVEIASPRAIETPTESWTSLFEDDDDASASAP